jgi:hypothetical protein
MKAKKSLFERTFWMVYTVPVEKSFPALKNPCNDPPHDP